MSTAVQTLTRSVLPSWRYLIAAAALLLAGGALLKFSPNLPWFGDDPSGLRSNLIAEALGVTLTVIVIQGALEHRDRLRRRPFFVYADECSDYLTHDFATGLEATRKFNVSWILGHQHLEQLTRDGTWLLNAVLTMPSVRVVFASGWADADRLSREMFTGTAEITGGRRKLELQRTCFAPRLE